MPSPFKSVAKSLRPGILSSKSDKPTDTEPCTSTPTVSESCPSPVRQPAPVIRRTLEDRPLEHLRNNMRREADGIWHCHKCRNEIVLKAYAGDHPFGHLICACKHTPCSECTTDKILQPFPSTASDPVVVKKSKRRDMPFGHICPNCGLTWRAQPGPDNEHPFTFPDHEHDYHKMSLQFLGRSCACGARSSEHWFRFHVGSNKEFKQGNPDAAYETALWKRVNQAVCTEWVGSPVPPKAPPSTLSSSLQRRLYVLNPDPDSGEESGNGSGAGSGSGSDNASDHTYSDDRDTLKLLSYTGLHSGWD